MRFCLLLLVCFISGCGASPRGPAQVQPLPPVEVFFTRPAPFAYRVGPEITSASAELTAVRADLGAQGAQLGCDAVVDVTISPEAQNEKARSWGFCAYRVSTR